jgi:hypothetical protein
VIVIERVFMAERTQQAQEDLAIQHTLSMSVEERLELIANLIIDKISEDYQQGEKLYKRLARYKDA